MVCIGTQLLGGTREEAAKTLEDLVNVACKGVIGQIDPTLYPSCATTRVSPTFVLACGLRLPVLSWHSDCHDIERWAFHDHECPCVMFAFFLLGFLV